MPITAPDPGCLDGTWRGSPLFASNLRLRALGTGDASVLAELAGDWEVARTTARIPHPYDLAAAEDFVAQAAREMAAGTGYSLAMERLADRRVVGCVGFRSRDGVPEIGYWTGRPFWRRGYASEAVCRLVRLVFTSFEGDRVTAEIMADNSASARVLENAGFSFEGVAEGREGRCAGVTMRRFVLAKKDWLARQANRPTVLVAAVALVDADGRVLVTQRPEGKTMAGLWEFPGGKVGAGETPEAALVRELGEELAIDLTESCLAPLAFASHVYEDFHLLMPLFACRVWKGAVTPREGQVLKWVRPSRLRDLPTPPADRPLVALLHEIL